MTRFATSALLVLAGVATALPSAAGAATLAGTPAAPVRRAAALLGGVRPRAASTPYRVVNLSALVGGGVHFTPTALNDAGSIVGYDTAQYLSTTGFFGAAYIISPAGAFGVLDNTGNKPVYFIPVAISNTGGSIAGNLLQFELALPADTAAPTTWTYAGTSSHQDYREFKAPPIFDIASNDVPVGGAYYFGYKKYSVTPFKTAGCAITDFSANAINDAGIVAGVGGGYAALDTTTGCARPLFGVPRLAGTSTSADAINKLGHVLVSLTGPAAPAFGAQYLDADGKLARVTLPPTYSSSGYYVDALALGDADAVVGNILEQAPPFATAAPFLYRNGSSVDLNALLPPKSGWQLLTAVGVNASGEIIGEGYYNGMLQGYALEP